LLALLSLYFGAWRPFQKSRLYIATQRNLVNVRTVDGFKENFNAVYEYYSPVGTEEITKFLASAVLTVVRDSDSQEVARELAAYVEERLFPDEVRHLLLAAQLRETLWQRFGQEEDYLAAVSHYQKARQIGPDLPQPLYQLFNLHAAAGDVQAAGQIGREILERWPQDEDLRAGLEQIETSPVGEPR
jgi:tetratricopeptide (TPR) repeat protein